MLRRKRGMAHIFWRLSFSRCEINQIRQLDRLLRSRLGVNNRSPLGRNNSYLFLLVLFLNPGSFFANSFDMRRKLLKILFLFSNFLLLF